MSTENVQRTRGRSQAYKPDAGGVPVDLGIYIGIVKNNVDTARTGQVEVYIPYLGGDENNPSSWKKVSYVSPFYGLTNADESLTGVAGLGNFLNNPHSYGMWFTSPDIGSSVVCFFAQGDPNQGFYMGSVVVPESHHMVPAIASSTRYTGADSPYLSNSTRLPVVEINDENTAADGARFFDLPKPIHQTITWGLLQQGVLNDQYRGSIGSGSYRESPSRVFGISTPGRPIYANNKGYKDADLLTAINAGALTEDDLSVIARRGGHSIVMDDGDISGEDQLVRIRTAQGHQIMLSDSGQALHIMHANGQSWIELGSEGTIDMYSTNSVNIRSAGDINMHADRNINLNSRYGSLNIASDRAVVVESDVVQITGTNAILMASDKFVGVRSDGTLSLYAQKAGTWEGGDNMVLSAGCIGLNSGKAPEVPETTRLNRYSLPDVKWVEDVGWQVEEGSLQTIASRAPTHEPYPLHGTGINTRASLTSVAESIEVPLEIETKLNSLADLQIATITAAEYDAQPLIDATVGSIQEPQLTAMIAQQSFVTGQDFNVISDAKGVGKFGFSAQQLENAGYLKPGTVDFYLGGEASESTILQSPNVWTGFAGVDNVSTLLNDENLQNAIQVDLYKDALTNLQNAGIMTGQENAADLGGLVQAASVYPVSTIKDWINGSLGDAAINADINTMVRGSQYAVLFADGKITDALAGLNTEATGVTDTVDRSDIAQSATSVVTDQRVELPPWVPDPAAPVREREVDKNGNTRDFNIDRGLPSVIRFDAGILTRIYGTRDVLEKYYGPFRSTDNV